MIQRMGEFLREIKEIGASDKTNTLFMSHSPSAIGDLFRQMQDAVLIGQKAATVG